MQTLAFEKLRSKSALVLVNGVLLTDMLRGAALNFAVKRLYTNLVEKNPDNHPRRVQEDKFYVLRNLFHSIDKALQQERISPAVRRALLKIFVENIILGEKERRRPFREKYFRDPPGFVTISPGKRCNLRCTGCYASSSAANAEKLDYDTVSRIVRETREFWGSHFTVISGGEPFMWRSDGKGIIDLAAEHQQTFFMTYTNGTLLDKKLVERLAEVGNITPAISVEGLEAETDGRRGKGVFKQILKSMQNLREFGIPFGISVTATRNNAELIVSDEFMDFFFDEQGAIYGWIFQYMPIGRHFTLDLMITPEQRLYMYEREQQLVREKKRFLVDFWNGGPVSNGCIAAGRSGGYVYIDWNGHVNPCVFFPYSTANIKEVYEQGGTLTSVLNAPFLKSIREWQNDYSYARQGAQTGNQIVPCPIRDHHAVARGIITAEQAQPIDSEAGEALRDDDYYDGMVAYGKRVAELTDEIWERDYIGPERKENKIFSEPETEAV